MPCLLQYKTIKTQLTNLTTLLILNTLPQTRNLDVLLGILTIKNNLLWDTEIVYRLLTQEKWKLLLNITMHIKLALG
jgi:hypothetical protein